MLVSLFFFFNDTATTEIYTLSLHDALPILIVNKSTGGVWFTSAWGPVTVGGLPQTVEKTDRKSTRLNSSHQIISYAVFCLKKKNVQTTQHGTITLGFLEYRCSFVGHICITV